MNLLNVQAMSFMVRSNMPMAAALVGNDRNMAGMNPL